jgi:CBS domain containing-hemolysin-like protein
MMRVQRNWSIAISCLGLLIFATATGAHAQQGPRRIALKSGESAELRNFYYVQNCQSIMIGTPVLDILQGPQELSVTLKEGTQRPQKCAKQVPGGTVVATAKEVKEQKETKLTIRLKFKTKIGERQSSNSYIVSLFP